MDERYATNDEWFDCVVKDAINDARKELPFNGMASMDLTEAIASASSLGKYSIILAACRNGPWAHYHHRVIFEGNEPQFQLGVLGAYEPPTRKGGDW